MIDIKATLVALGVFIATAMATSVVQAADMSTCTTVVTCEDEVSREVARQDAAASSGPQWGPVSQSQCAIASREQEANERRCKAYDLKRNGKTLKECAKCYRQVRFDIARWEQCHRAGFAPAVPRAIYQSLARLGRSVRQLQ